MCHILCTTMWFIKLSLLVFSLQPRCIKLSWFCFQSNINIYIYILWTKPQCRKLSRFVFWKQSHWRFMHLALVLKTFMVCCQNNLVAYNYNGAAPKAKQWYIVKHQAPVHNTIMLFASVANHAIVYEPSFNALHTSLMLLPPQHCCLKL